MKKGTFVTAKIANPELDVDVCQGVYWDDNSDGTIQVQGESGTVYHCLPNVTIVPDQNLWGDTKDFVNTLRKQHKYEYNWAQEA